MDERLRTYHGWAKHYHVAPERMKQGLEAQAEQDPNHRPVLLPSRQAHRQPRKLWRAASVEALFMRSAAEAQRVGGFAAAIIYIPADAASPMQLVSVFHDQALVAELQKLAVVHHAQGRTHVVPGAAQKVLADLEAARRVRARQVVEPSKSETPAPTKLAASPRRDDE